MKIDINGKREISVQSDITLFQALSDNQIYLPTVCGGRGFCGACKCKVTAGGSQIVPSELRLLTPEELAGSVRLACQVNVINDMSIMITDTQFYTRSYQTVVEKITDLTNDIKSVVLKLIEPNVIEFKAGQYVLLEIPPYAKSKQKVIRAYSISSKPEDKTKVELIIRLVPEGIGTTWVHKYLKAGDAVTLTGPYGEFYIRDTQADMIFVAGGSGKAPIKSMLEHLQVVGSNRRMVYFFGARSKQDLYLTEEFTGFEKVFPDFRYYPVLSQVVPEDNWTGKTGYVIPYLAEQIKDPINTEAYMCGSPAMLNAVLKELIRLGVPKEKIYYDSFG